MPDIGFSDLNRVIKDIQHVARVVQHQDRSARRLWNEVVNVLAPRLKARFDAQQGPDGAWEANRGEYGVLKRELGIPIGVGLDAKKAARFRKGLKTGKFRDASGQFTTRRKARRGVRSGKMARMENFHGTLVEEGDEMVWKFGTNDFDARKGMWFHWGSGPAPDDQEHSGAKNQPPRHFWELTDLDEEKVVVALEEALREILED